MSENTIIVRLRNQQEVVAHSDPKGFQFQRVSGYIGVSDFIQLFEKALNGVNPRNATRNRVVKDILETLEYSPELFWIMSKGIMVSTFYCKNWNVIVIGSHSKRSSRGHYGWRAHSLCHRELHCVQNLR